MKYSQLKALAPPCIHCNKKMDFRRAPGDPGGKDNVMFYCYCLSNEHMELWFYVKTGKLVGLTTVIGEFVIYAYDKETYEPNSNRQFTRIFRKGMSDKNSFYLNEFIKFDFSSYEAVAKKVRMMLVFQ